MGLICTKKEKHEKFTNEDIEHFKRFVKTVQFSTLNKNYSDKDNTSLDGVKTTYVPVKNMKNIIKKYIIIQEKNNKNGELERISKHITPAVYKKKYQKIDEMKGLPSTHKNVCETGDQLIAKSFLAIPLKIEHESRGKEITGVIRLPRTENGQIFSDFEVSLLEKLTTGISKLSTTLNLKLEKRKKYHKDLLSTKLLEKVRNINELTFGGLFGKDGAFLEEYGKEIMMEDIVINVYSNILKRFSHLTDDNSTKSKPLAKILDYSVFERLLRKQEGYREHLIHQFQVFLLGCYFIDCDLDFFLDLYERKYINDAKSDRDQKIEKLGFSWFLASFMHDFGYYFIKFNPLFDDLFKDTWHIESPIQSNFENLIKGENVIKDIQLLTNAAMELLELDNDFNNNFPSFERMLIEKLTNEEKLNHGLFSAFLLFRSIMSDRKRHDKNIIYPIVGIALHDWKIWRESTALPSQYVRQYDLNFKFIFEKQIITALLIICDNIQEWGRPDYFSDPDGNDLNETHNENDIVFDLHEIKFKEGVFEIVLKIDEDNPINQEYRKRLSYRRNSSQEYQNDIRRKTLEKTRIGNLIQEILKREKRNSKTKFKIYIYDQEAKGKRKKFFFI